MTKVLMGAVVMGLVTGYVLWGAVILGAAAVCLVILIAAGSIVAIRYRKGGHPAAAICAPCGPHRSLDCVAAQGRRDVERRRQRGGSPFHMKLLTNFPRSAATTRSAPEGCPSGSGGVNAA
jgi:hypothetical protein